MACGCPTRAALGKDRLQLADVLRTGLADYPRRLPPHHWKTLNALLNCRTGNLGGHLYRCEDCGREHFVPHSCRNRHCPNCQKARAIQWLEKETASLLPVPYFHIVFTLPHEFNALIAQNQRILYNLLFSAASATLLEFGDRRMKARIGITAVLHTWSQTQMDHYHLHCVVTGGGLSREGQIWQSANPNYLFPVKALSIVFRAKFRDGIKQLHENEMLSFHGTLEPLRSEGRFRSVLAQALRSNWVVYAKRPFAGPQQVLSYLSRYTHRVAIGNGRLLHLDSSAGKVTFSYKDYADHARRKKMTLDIHEFIRRFCLHILPERFVKIRHYGLLGNHKRAEKIQRARTLIAAATNATLPLPEPKSDTTAEPLRCPHCGSQHMLFLERRKGCTPPTPNIDSS